MSCGDCEDCQSYLKTQENLHDSITSLYSDQDNRTENCNVQPCRGVRFSPFCEKVPERKFFDFCRRLFLCQKGRKYCPTSNFDCWYYDQNQEEHFLDDCNNFHNCNEATLGNTYYDCCCPPYKPKRLFRLYPIPEMCSNKFSRFSTCHLASNRRRYSRAYRNRHRRRSAGRKLFNWPGI